MMLIVCAVCPHTHSLTHTQELADERLVELQMVVQCADQVEAEIQVLLKQLQDLQSSMFKTNQQKEEVNLRYAFTAA